MNQEELTNTIEELTKKLEEMKKRQEYLSAQRKKLEAQKQSGNQIGFYAMRSLKEIVETIKVIVAQIDLEKQDEHEILTSLNIINKRSYDGIRAIDRDATERGEE
jgi:phage shock protein A